MIYKRRKKIKRYKRVKLHEYAIVFNDSEHLIEFVCYINTANITNSCLYVKDSYYILLLSANKPLNSKTHITFEDKLHIDKIKLNTRLICKHDVIQKMQKAFIKP